MALGWPWPSALFSGLSLVRTEAMGLSLSLRPGLTLFPDPDLFSVLIFGLTLDHCASACCLN
jgi:hypothetical protein